MEGMMEGRKDRWKERRNEGKKTKKKKTLDIIIRRENPESRNPVEIKS